MKQFDPIQEQPDKVKIVNQRQVEYEKKFLGTQVRYNGHTMFEINCTTGQIKPAVFKEEKILMVEKKNLFYDSIDGMTPLPVKDIDCQENCLYISALNIKSVQKKYLKWLLDQKGEKIQSNQSGTKES